ncbi:PEP-CTERM sorting domain-containing protein [Sphingomonas piscis]|uniref:PEP-CTERM sorting domain-containing protein n=1 Tax=Sphingomonas piscis TaxID=2714943 RepID=A0A6G7YQW1_9SPHN|nr:PEPxxWA-CTERM sorting domain-containing protein [Sphingomonas piscis]QIK79130.1 PEP-CTERM sorting domain-containing protein [Sphingomonas piscis]
MKRLLLLAAMAASVATPAAATVTLAPSKGQLANHINGDDRNDGDANTVFGRSETGGEVKFTANTAIGITNGFASVSEIVPKGEQEDFFWLIVNPDEAFSKLDFSVQFLKASTFQIDYGLVGGATGSLGVFSQNSDKLVDYLLSGDNGESFDYMKITSLGSAIKLEKQNSLELASVTAPVPEASTWAMMLVGFGGVGAAMRRRRRTGVLTPQVA